MKVYDVFKEYIWLVQTIYRHKRITLDDINELWRKTDMSGGNSYNRITFKRHRDAIEEIFGLYIECDRKGGYKYYIGNRHVLEEDTVQNWLLSTLTVNNIISESLSLQDRIQIEAIPDDRYLVQLIEAMKNSRKVEIAYHRFGTDTVNTHTFCPYALKVYQHRWYVLAFFEESAKNHKPHFAIFSFDRIEQVRILNEKFKLAKDFNLKEFFKDNYGIMVNDGMKTERVVIRAFEKEVFNLRTLPLHQSQKEIETTNDYSDFELYLKPTLDFSGKLLSRGGCIEVKEPLWLREEIKNMYKTGLSRYED